MMIAHTPDMKTGTLVKKIKAHKDLMIFPNKPRFVRSGDILDFTGKLVNFTENRKTAEVTISFFNPCDNSPIKVLKGKSEIKTTIRLPASKSISFSDLEKINLPIEAELHLMVKDPLLWVRDWRKIKRIIYHYEIEKSHQEIIKAFKEKGFKVGMALNPQTPWQVLTEFLKDLDLVLFMSVNPGFYGSKFIPEVLEKIKEFIQKNY